METLMRWLAFAFLIWCLGGGCGWWRGPLGVLSDFWWHVRYGHHQPSSEPDQTSGQDTDDDVLSGHEDPPTERRLNRPLDGPSPLDELRAAAGIDDQADELPPRREWVADRIADGWRATDIDEEGAELYGTSTKTIARDRRALAARTQRGTMGGRTR